VKLAKLAGAAASVAAVVLFSGCPEDPYNVDTWTGKLRDPHESERAVTEIQNLCNPKAIGPLGEAWKDDGKPTRHLTVLIDLARPLTAGPGGEADVKNCTDYVEKGRDAHWDDALPYLRMAIVDISDINNQREVDSGVKAAEALGESAHPEGVQILVDAINRKMGPKDKGQNLRRAAIMALANYKDKKAIDTLANVLRSDVTTTPPQIMGAAINTLGKMRTADALPILIEGMFRLPPFFQQIRRALIAAGGDVKSEMRKILRGEHANVNALFQEKKLDKYCGEDDPEAGKDAPPGEKKPECESVSAMAYFSASVIGDLYDKDAIDDLIAALKKDPKPAYYSQWNPGPPAHNAILDALRKIGDPRSAQAVLDLWANPKTDQNLRAFAIQVYGFVTADGSEKSGGKDGLSMLVAIASDNKADTAMRLAASETVGRLASENKYADSFKAQADKYAKESKKKIDEAAGKPKTELDAANTKFEAAKKEYEEAQKEADKVLAEAEKKRQTMIEEAKAKGDDAKVIKSLETASPAYFVDASFEPVLTKGIESKKKFEEIRDKTYAPAKEKYDSLVAQGNGYKGYQRGFENHIARIELAQHCAGQVKCLMETFDAKPDEIFQRLKAAKLIDVKDDKEWSEGEREDLKVAQIERAVLELRKLGAGAKDQLSKLLDAAKSTDRLVREAILLALPRIAPVPCDECVTKLDGAIAAGQGKQELASLNFETELVRDYFSWAGKK